MITTIGPYQNLLLFYVPENSKKETNVFEKTLSPDNKRMKKYQLSYELLDNIFLGVFLGEVKSRRKKKNLIQGT